MELPFRERANAFLCDDAKLGRKRGTGQEAHVWRHPEAIEVFEREPTVSTELKCYQILDGYAKQEIDASASRDC